MRILSENVRKTILFEDMRAFTRPQDSAFYVSLSGTSYCDSSYYIERINSENAVIEYVLDGEGWIEFDSKTYHVERDMIYLLPARKDQRYWADRTSPFTKVFMNLNGDFTDKLIHAYGLSGKYVFDAKNLKAPFERIQLLLHSARSGEEIQSCLQGIFVEILSGLSRCHSESKYSSETLTLKRYLDDNTGKIISSRELASIIFRSPDYCQKLFLREFGMTPYEYQLKNKINIAKTYLANTNMSIGQISEALGYSDQHHFSNLFKSKCGISPLAWRKR